MLKKIGIIILLGLLVSTPSSAYLPTTFAGLSAPVITPPLVPCSGAMTGQLDFSNPCNLIYYHQVMK